MAICARARCYRHATDGRDDGLCYRHRGELRNLVLQKQRREEREQKPTIGRPLSKAKAECTACGRRTRQDKLRAGVCGKCRQRARTRARHAAQVETERARLRNACSVAGCTRPRELERACIEHAPRFDCVKQPRSLRAEDFAVRTRDPREGV